MRVTGLPVAAVDVEDVAAFVAGGAVVPDADGFVGFADAAAVIAVDVAVVVAAAAAAVECYSGATRFLAAYSVAYGWDAAARQATLLPLAAPSNSGRGFEVSCTIPSRRAETVAPT